MSILILKMEAAMSYHITERRHNPEDGDLNLCRPFGIDVSHPLFSYRTIL